MSETSIIENRLRKNFKRLKGWLKSEGITCYRLYDKDIPEYPYIVDIYDKHAIVYEKGIKLDDSEQALRLKHILDIKLAIINSLSIEEENIILKSRHIQKGQDQYNKLSRTEEFHQVEENGLLFRLNFRDYLDTGLFLDHRPLRKIVRKESKQKKVLNLFAYTGSISVNAAFGEGKVTTVDLSNTYVSWAKENFKLNGIDTGHHQFITKDVFQFLKQNEEKYDLIILDPPSFSNSKKTDSIFDVQRDHRGLVELAMLRLNKKGVLYFSNNFRKFKLDPSLEERFHVQEITEKTIPRDFRDQKIHKAFKIQIKTL